MLTLLAFLFLAIFVSFLCSVMESVLLSTPQSFLLLKRDEGEQWAQAFMDMKQRIDRPLSAILSLNTVAHTIGAAGVGAQAVVVFGEMYFGLVSAILTLMILVFTEIIPKTIGARYWRNLSKFSYYTIRIMILITYPLVVLSALITRFISGSGESQTASREEIAAMASLSAEEGVFTDKEHKVIQNILKLKNLKVSEIMTPRVVVAVADENLSLSDFMRHTEYLNFSRIPVYFDNIENINGYVFRQDVMEQLALDKHSTKLKELKRQLLVTPDNISIFFLWERLLEEKEHMALVVDEYGGFDGIVTMEDIIETLLGLEIVDERDKVTDMRKYARERWNKRQAKYKLINKPGPEASED